MAKRRWTTRRLLLLVIIAALLLGAEAARRRLRRQAERDSLKYQAFEASAKNMEEFANLQDQGAFRAPGGSEGEPQLSSELLRRRAVYYHELAKKYGTASRNPWIHLDPDPSAPGLILLIRNCGLDRGLYARGDFP